MKRSAKIVELELAHLDLPDPGPERGDAALAAGDLDGALRAWTEALAVADEADDEAARVALVARLARARRRVAWRRLAPPALVLVVLLPAVAGLGWRLAERAEVERREAARAALDVARADVARLAPEAAIEALADVALRYPGTPAADDARRGASDLAGGLTRARAEADEAQVLVGRAAYGAAVVRLDAARGALAAWPDLPLARLLERRRDEAARADALARAKGALERGEPAAVAGLLGDLPRDDDEAERGRAAARYAEVALAAQAALERQELGAALPLLREANGLAARAGETARDLAPLEATWRVVRRLRGRARLERGARALADGDLEQARVALTLPPAEQPDEPALAARLEALRRLALTGLPDGMVLVPGGRVARGDVLAPDELPVELVDVAPFLVDRREVTRGAVQSWLAATSTPAPPGWRAPANPAEAAEPARGVSWREASAYAAWAGKRLLTETEWEAAARLERPDAPSVSGAWDERAAAALERLEAALGAGVAWVSSSAEGAWVEALARKKGPPRPPAAPALTLEGDPHPVVTGDDVVVSPAAALAAIVARRWPWGGFWDGERCRVGGARPEPAGAAGASPWGVEDLAGSVAEWTSSEYRPHAGPLRAAPEGKGRRVVKGGSWKSLPEEARTSFRAAYAPEVRFDDVGFRCGESVQR